MFIYKGLVRRITIWPYDQMRLKTDMDDLLQDLLLRRTELEQYKVCADVCFKCTHTSQAYDSISGSHLSATT